MCGKKPDKNPLTNPLFPTERVCFGPVLNFQLLDPTECMLVRCEDRARGKGVARRSWCPDRPSLGLRVPVQPEAARAAVLQRSPTAERPLVGSARFRYGVGMTAVTWLEYPLSTSSVPTVVTT